MAQIRIRTNSPVDSSALQAGKLAGLRLLLLVSLATGVAAPVAAQSLDWKIAARHVAQADQSHVHVRGRASLPDDAVFTVRLLNGTSKLIVGEVRAQIEAGGLNCRIGPFPKPLHPGLYVVKASFNPNSQSPAVKQALIGEAARRQQTVEFEFVVGEEEDPAALYAEFQRQATAHLLQLRELFIEAALRVHEFQETYEETGSLTEATRWYRGWKSGAEELLQSLHSQHESQGHGSPFTTRFAQLLRCADRLVYFGARYSETTKGKPTLAPEDQNKTFEQLDKEGKLPWRMVRAQFFQALQQSYRLCAIEDPGYRELALVYDAFQRIVLKTARKFWKLFPEPQLPPEELEPLRLEWEEFEGQLLSLWEALAEKRERTSLLYGDSASGNQSRSSREINAIVAKLDRLQGELEELRKGINSYLNEEPEASQPALLEEKLIAHVWELGREVHAQAVGAVEETYRSLTAIETLFRVRSGMGGPERDKAEAVREAVQRWESSPHPEARDLCRKKADYLVELGGIHSSLYAFRRDGDAIAELDEDMEDFKDLCLQVTEDLDRVDEVTRAVEELNAAWRALKDPPVRRQ